jgi:hypothetical protein
MEPSDAILAGRARRAYELGRLRFAARTISPFALALAVAAAHVGSWQAGALALTATLVLVAGRAYGRALGRGVYAGAIAGMVALICPIAVTALAHRCAGCGPSSPMPLCLLACAVGGALAAWWTSRAGAFRTTEAAIALATAALVGSVGCVVAGGFGLLGLAAGLVLGGVPQMLVRASR